MGYTAESFIAVMDTQEIVALSRAAYVSLLKESLGRIVETLASLEQVERVSLFGSYAQGVLSKLAEG